VKDQLPTTQQPYDSRCQNCGFVNCTCATPKFNVPNVTTSGGPLISKNLSVDGDTRIDGRTAEPCNTVRTEAATPANARLIPEQSCAYVGVHPRRVHQRQLDPAANKFHKGNGSDGKHYWLIPPDLYAKLNAEFNFDFDPCPHPKPADFDGLTCEWGKRNWVNPPFGSILHDGKKKGPTAWMRKSITERDKGKLSVVVYPVDKWILLMLAACGVTEVRNLGDVKWCAIEDGSAGKGTGRHIAAFILRPKGSA
jgi:hypothetical protein